jgi:glutamine amidotransferase
MKLVIIDYGAGNIKSIQFAFERLGVHAVLSSDAKEIQAADKVIFPGVGAAGAAMKMLKDKNLDTLIPKLTQPVLGICLGLQLMCRYSEEDHTPGLGIFDVDVKRFDASKVKVPQIGWNSINSLKTELFDGVDEDSYIYMVHSYFVPKCDQTISEATYDGAYSAALRRDNFYATQFHPEKSSSVGEQILKNFLAI